MSDDFISLEAILEKLKMKRIHLEMRLGISIGELENEDVLHSPETQALFRLLYNMPWVLEVAQSGFDKEKANEVLLREAVKVKADLDMRGLFGND